MTDDLLTQSQSDDGHTIFTFTQADLARVDPGVLDAELAAIADEVAATAVTLDFQKVTALTSMNLGSCVMVFKRLKRRGIRLAVVNLNAEVLGVFETTQLKRLIDIVPPATDRDIIAAD